MANSGAEKVLGHLNRWLNTGRKDDDAHLLERFVQHRDEDAFAELVARHGPLVFGLCHRILANRHDAEDVFQATFLVLARKAATIRKPESLACWLHGVAYRLALKAKSAAERRRLHEQQAVHPSSSDENDLSWREMRGVIDEELQRLPQKQRLPLVLCYLEGLTQDEAAQQLGWPRGTLKRRLEAGREKLRLRLTQRGVTLGGGLFAVALTESASRGALPLSLHLAAVKAAVAFASGEAGALATTQAALLAKGALQTMLTTKLKLGTMLILLLGCAVTLAGLTIPPAPADKRQDNKAEAPAPPRLADSKLVRKDRYGDPLPEGAMVRLGTVRLRHCSGISPVVFTRDGRTAIVGDGDGDLVYWDVASGREVRRLPRILLNPPNGLAISADGKTLAANANQSLFLFDVATGKLQSKSEKSSDGQLLFAPDGQTLAIRGSKSIVLWDVVRKRKRHELKGHPDYVKCMAFSPDGKTLASAGESDPHIRLWDVATGKERLHLIGDKNINPSLAFSPDGKTLALIGESGRLVFFDPNSGKKLRTATEDYIALSALHYAPDGKTLAGIERFDRVCIVDADSGNRIRIFDAPPRAMNGLSISTDGKTLATFWPDAHTFDLWDITSGKIRSLFAGHCEGVRGVAFSADGKTLFSVTGQSDDELLAWNADTGELRGQLGEYGKGYNGIALSPDGKLLAACGHGAIHLWDPLRRKKVRDWKAENLYGNGSLAWSADSRTLVSIGHSDKIIHIWDAVKGKQRRTIVTKQDWPTGVALSPDGETAAVGGYQDGAIHWWSVATGKERSKIATPQRPTPSTWGGPPRKFYSMIGCLAFHPDGAVLASAGMEGEIYLWDAATGRRLRHWETKLDGIACLAFSWDGRTLVTGHRDSRVRLWEVATGKERACFVGHRGPVLSAVFARDGRRLASGSEDTTILVWDARGGARSDAALSAEQLRSLWDDLLGTDAPRAHRSQWQLALSSQQALPFLAERLRSIAAHDAERMQPLERLLADLDNDSFAVREKAAAALEMRGPYIEPELRKVLEGKPSLEVRRRIEMVLENIAVWSGERLRTLRALEALEHMNTPESRQLLETLANGVPRAWLTEETRAMRRRMER